MPNPNPFSQAEQLLAMRNLAAAATLFAHQPPSDQVDAGLWQCAMLLGDFASAWQAADRIRSRNTPDPHRFWQGEPIAGKRVIVRCLHGYGDALQFLRYLPLLNATAASVTLEVPLRLASLARHLSGAVNVLTWDDPQPAWDVQVEVMELPYLFRTQPHDLPIAERYLQIPTPVPLPPTGNLRVGLVCTAGQWNPTRAIPESLLKPLLEISACEFWNLSSHPTSLPLLELPEARTDLLALAGLVSQLDLVLTTDTLASHLAGALGIPAWVMLQHAADWRWQHLRPDSPWYPNHRLFRQPGPGNWLAVIDKIGEELVLLSDHLCSPSLSIP